MFIKYLLFIVKIFKIYFLIEKKYGIDPFVTNGYYSDINFEITSKCKDSDVHGKNS
jgi:hypothetical protein